MAFLISAVADLMHNPGGLWEILILRVFKFIGNYGWRILFFTVCLKLLLLPLDLYQRFKMRKNQLITERIKPQLEKLQQQYAGDRTTLSQKQMQLQRQEGFSYFSSCLPMIVTLVIFFYLFAGLNNISRFKNLQQYVELYDAYTAVETVERSQPFAYEGLDEALSYNQMEAEKTELEALQPAESDYKDANGDWGGEKGGESEYNAARAAWGEAYQARVTLLTAAMNADYDTVIKPKAQDAAVERYGQVQESFLWVSNIWSPDVPWKKAILSYSQFKTNISGYSSYGKATKKLKMDKTKIGQDEFSDMISETKYNMVTEKLRTDKHYNKVNGFLILPILSVGLSFLSQFITSRLQKRSGQAAPEGGMAGSMKMMMIIMPLMMGAFALSYTAMFTLYIVVNSGMTILINVLTTLGMEGRSKRNDKMRTTGIQKYGRPDPNDL